MPTSDMPRLTGELIEKYAKILEQVYQAQTAGDYTFHGILAKFLNEYEKLD